MKIRSVLQVSSTLASGLIALIGINLSGCLEPPLKGRELLLKELQSGRLVDHYIPTEGKVKYISLIDGEKYTSQALNERFIDKLLGAKLTNVEGRFEYCIQQAYWTDRNCPNREESCLKHYGCDVRSGSITLANKQNKK